jgi:membrane dipeptidase
LTTTYDERIVIDGLNISGWDRALFEQARDAGLSCVHVTCAVWENAAETFREIARWRALLEDNEDLVCAARTGDDVRRAAAEGKVAFVLGFQNASPVEDDLRLLAMYADLGVRIIQLSYNNQNLLATGCYEGEDGGVTAYGREVIAEMNRLGLLIDLSHVGERSTLEAIECSERPVAITHANPRWFNDIARNKSDAVLEALVARGGMLGLCTFPMLLAGGQVDSGRRADCTLEQFCEMVARTVDQLGVDHVALATDFTLNRELEFFRWLRSGRWTRDVFVDGLPTMPPWAASLDCFRTLHDGLAAQGLDDDAVGKIIGGNWLRMYSESFEPATVPVTT